MATYGPEYGTGGGWLEGTGWIQNFIAPPKWTDIVDNWLQRGGGSAVNEALWTDPQRPNERAQFDSLYNNVYLPTVQRWNAANPTWQATTTDYNTALNTPAAYNPNLIGKGGGFFGSGLGQALMLGGGLALGAGALGAFDGLGAAGEFIGGGEGAGSLIGGTGADTLGGVFDVNGGLSSLGTTGTGTMMTVPGEGAAFGGGSMDFTNSLTDLFGSPGGSIFDVNGGLSTMGTSGIGTSGGSLGNFDLTNWLNNPNTMDIFGDPLTGNAFNLGNSGTGTVPLDSSGLPSNISNYLKQILGGGASGPTGISRVLQGLGVGGGLSDVLGGGLSLAAREAPGMLALQYAKNNGTGADLTGMNGILASLQGNQNAVIKAATDPFQMNIAAGYGDLLQNQALRGVRGSSFGNTDIANYISTTGNALANAGANAAQGSLALQGNLAGNIANLTNQNQQMKNNLYGRAFSVLGQGLNPSPTFNLAGA